MESYFSIFSGASMITVFENCRVFDGVNEQLIDGASVVIKSDRIKEITRESVKLKDAKYIDCAGRLLMPGLIDAHVHANTPTYSFYTNDRMPPSLLANHAAGILEGMLQRGFTTVRDAGGGDRGLWQAIEAGLIQGPRYFYAGKAISQTGGHGDMRPGDVVEPCSCGHYAGSISKVADGVDEVRKAVREELRQGAHQIKIFVSGGVSSPTDPIWMPQYTEEEIRAAVYEASTHRTYVMAHCHTDDGARRCAEFGVRTIEHGTEIHRDTAELLAEKGVYVVPTLSTMHVISTQGEALGLPPASLDKIKGVYERTLTSIENCQRAGVKLGLGSDLLDVNYHPLQGSEFRHRGAVSKPIDVLRSATSINAEILQRTGELGCIAPGALADMIVLDFDPFKDLSGFENAQQNIPVIMHGGQCIKNDLS